VLRRKSDLRRELVDTLLLPLRIVARARALRLMLQLGLAQLRLCSCTIDQPHTAEHA
jgi:hypothetical protein